MTFDKSTIIHIVLGTAGIASLAVFIGLILIPAIKAYSRLAHRLAAAFLSLYVLAAMVGIGGVLGIATVWFWDKL